MVEHARTNDLRVTLYIAPKKDLKEERPSFDLFKDKFRSVSYSNSERSRQFIRYVLQKIDDYYSTGEKKPDFAVVNVEHILPRNPHKEWNLNKDKIKPYVNKLGNLTLIHKKINSKIGNQIIKKKIDHLKDSEFNITKKLVQKLEGQDYQWDQEEIEKRQDELAKIAYDHIWNF